MKKYLAPLFFLLASLAASAQPLCVVWTGEPADKCDRQQQAKPQPSRPAQSASSNPLGVEWGGKSTEQRSARPATTSPQPGSGWVGGGRTPDAPKPAADNGLGVQWAGGTPAPAAPRPTSGNGLGVEWAGGNQTPAAPRPTSGNGLGVEWAGGTPAPAAPRPTSGNGLGMEWAGGTPAPAAPRPISGNGLGVEWAGGTLAPAAPRPTGGNGLGVEWAGGTPVPAAPRPTSGNGLGVEWGGGNQAPAAPGPAAGNGLGLEWAGGSRNAGSPSTGDLPATCNVAEFDQKLAQNSSDSEYVKQQVKHYTDMMANALRNGFTCTDCNTRLSTLALEVGRIQRERDQLLQLKNQCIAANNRSGQGSQSSPAPSAIAAACLPIQEKLEKYRRWYQDVAASWNKDCRNAAYYPPSCGGQYKAMQSYAEQVEKSEAELKACRQNS